LREPAFHSGRPVPSAKELKVLAEKYEYTAFEHTYKGWRRPAKLFINKLRQRR
jgi:hypothetical protein